MAIEGGDADVPAQPVCRAAGCTRTERNAASAKRRRIDVTDASSSGATARTSTNISAGVEVVARNGRMVKLNGPIEVTWSHGQPYPLPHGAGFMCYYCHKSKKGGGVSRLRQHLGGIPGSVKECNNVPLYIKTLMADEDTAGRIRSKRGTDLRLYVEREVAANRISGRTRIPLDEEGQVEMAMRESLRDSTSVMQHDNSPPFGKSACSGVASSSANHQTKLHRFYKNGQSANAPFDIDLARSRAQVQPRVDVMLDGVSKEQLGKAWAKWFHANDVPGRKADCPYFRSAMKLTQQFGEGVAIPRGREIDGPLLDMNYADMEAHMAEFKDDWKDYGVTIMCDSWTGPTMMSIINFMIYCNGRMFFHKSVNATGLIQNAEYILDILSEVVVGEIGVKHVVQIVTDNGSNYKKACQDLVAKYPHITWQPCAAHTTNLMLKDISRFPDVSEVVDSAKRICRFLYNHNRLHAMMREKIGGELVRWNATRFGTVFIFLQSFWDRLDKFRQWMVSDDWENCAWAGTADHEFTYDCLTSKKWWSEMEVVLKAVSPIYSVLRLADQQKSVSISAFVPKMLSAMTEIRGNLSGNHRQRNLLDRLMVKVNTRLNYLVNNTLMLAAAALDPKALYTSKIARKPKSRHAVTLAIKKLARSSSKASAAIDQFTFFSKQGGLFGGAEARNSALSGRCSYGGDCSELQEVAHRIVSQCMSSSGCERNWSTFALVHTKLRNRLSYDKLHKLVFVHYNLKLRIQHFETDMQSLQEMQTNHERDSDPCSIMIDVAMYDENNPIMDWLCSSRSESVPTLDEYDDMNIDEYDEDGEPVAPNPSRLVIEELGIDDEEVVAFKEKVVRKRGKKRKGGFEEEDLASDFESESDQQGSPRYAESGDSSSDDGEMDDDGDIRVSGTGDGDGGETERVGGGSVAGDGAQDEQPTSLRPKSKRMKKRPVKNLY